MTRPTADHPHADPGDGRTECQPCGKYVWPAIHSCKGVPVTPAAQARRAAVHAETYPRTVLAGSPYTDADVDLVARVGCDDFYGRGSWATARPHRKHCWGEVATAILTALAAAGRLAPADPDALPGPHVLDVGKTRTVEHPADCTVRTPTGPVLICLVDELVRTELTDTSLPAGRYEVWAADEADLTGRYLRVGDQLPNEPVATELTCYCEDLNGRLHGHPRGTGRHCSPECPDPWHSSPTEPGQPCPTCGDPQPGQPTTGDDHTSSTIAVSSRFARAAAGRPDDGRDWVRLRTGSGRQYEGHRAPACPGDGATGHQHDIRCVDRAQG